MFSACLGYERHNGIQSTRMSGLQLKHIIIYGVSGRVGENPLSDDSFERDDPLTDISASSELSSLYSSK